MDLPKHIIDILTETFLDISDESTAVKMQAFIAENENCPVDLLVHLSKSPSDFVLDNVAVNPNTPINVLKRLSKHDSWSVRDNVARNIGTPSNILYKLLDDDDADVINGVFINPNITVDDLIKFSRKQCNRIKSHVARHPLTPIDILEKLSKSEYSEVRKDVAKNPNISIEILKELLRDSSHGVVSTAIDSDIVTEDILLELHNSTSINYSILKSLTSKDICPSKILENLHMDTDQNVRYWIAKNPNTPRWILEKYARYRSHGARGCVSSNPKCPYQLKLLLNEYQDREDFHDLVKMYLDGMKFKAIKEFIDIEKTFEDLAFN